MVEYGLALEAPDRKQRPRPRCGSWNRELELDVALGTGSGYVWNKGSRGDCGIRRAHRELRCGRRVLIRPSKRSVNGRLFASRYARWSLGY